MIIFQDTFNLYYIINIQRFCGFFEFFMFYYNYQ